MTNSKIRTLRWIAPVAMAGVLGFAACGGANAAEDARTETRVASRGSDTHLYNQAEETAGRSASAGRGSDTRLYNQAEELAKVFAERSASAEQLERTAKLEGQADTYRASSAPRVIVSAEQIERQAKLDGSAKTYGVSSGNRAALAAEAERYVEQLEANAKSQSNRAALAAEAERYVEQLEANAESTQVSSSHEFVPGTRHMPVR
jgi:hypothetical protein